MKKLFFLFYLVTVTVTVSLLVNGATESELRALLEFKKGIQNDPSNKITSTWALTSTASSPDPNTCPDTWTGISCDPETGSIVGVNLDRLGLTGDLKFSTLTELKSLQNLSLSGNSLTGRLVPALGTMNTLRYIDLSSNQFYGPIPGRFTDLWNLNHLNLSANNFTGGFPVGFTNLQQLRVLDLHSNSLWGDIGSVFAELKNVEVLDLSRNQFSGGLSLHADNVSGLANTLRRLDLSRNGLNGGFFKEETIGLFRSLEVLDLGYNGIGGELPSLIELRNLKVLRLGNNQLFGAVPPELLQSVIQMNEVDLGGNGFTGSVPEINSTTLNILNLTSNRLSGPLPATIKSCVVVDLSKNMISDQFNVVQNWEANLEVLDLSSNLLSGSFPNLPTHFEKLSMLNIRNNSIVGNLPSALGVLAKLAVVDLSSNKLGGSIPGSLFSAVSLTSLNLSKNHFTGPIPLQGSHASELLVVSSHPPMESLDLSSNSLAGGLPSEIGSLDTLKLLNLASNDLSGKLPTELNKLSNLEYLDLSGNKFNGQIPAKLSPYLTSFNVSNNDLSGHIPENLRTFPLSSFRPGNSLLVIPDGVVPSSTPGSGLRNSGGKSRKSGIKVAIIVASVFATLMVAFVLWAYYRAQRKDFRGRSGFTENTGRDVKSGGILSRPSLFNFKPNVQPRSTSLSFSQDHLLTSNSRTLSGPTESVTEISEHVPDNQAATTSGRKSSPGSPISSSPRFIENPPVMLDVYSPDRLAGELFFLDDSLTFTAEELSRAPAEVLGRSSHGTLYKATLDSGHMLTVKWLRVGLVKHKKEFAKEVKKIGAMRYPNIVPLRAYYWGPREQERLLLADFVRGDSLALHLYETTPRRYSPLSFAQRLKVAVEVAQCLLYLHDRGLPHGNLKPTNILLAGPAYSARVSDYGLHRLMTPAGISEQILNLGALGYRAPELATAAKPIPSYKADVYAFGVICMELLTRRSAGDIISGHSGAVDLTDWVRLCDQEGRGMDCIDRDIAGGEEHIKAMDDLLAIALRCILPVNERPNIRQIFEDLRSLSA
ncbi:hypothetical protein ACFE04_019321 [Oxalis oulophora]